WRYSPVYFAKVMEVFLGRVRSRLAREGVVAHLINFQDDVLGGAPDRENAMAAVDIVVEEARQCGFHTRREKFEMGDTVSFCGLKLRGTLAMPSERSPLTAAVVEEALRDFEDAKDEEGRRGIVRRWCGKFQWLAKWLPVSLQVSLARLHKVDVKSSEASMLMNELAEAYFAGLIALHVLGSDADFTILGSIVVADCNKDGWGAVLFNLIEYPTGSSFSETTGLEGSCGDWLRSAAVLTKVALTELGVRLADGRSACVLPICIGGGLLSDPDKRRSSTFKERKSQILAVNKFLPLLHYPCLVASDNKNSTLWWHCFEEEYASTEEDFRLAMTFQRNVTRICWLPRDCVSVVDRLARVPTLPTDADVPLKVESDDPLRALLFVPGIGDLCRTMPGEDPDAAVMADDGLDFTVADFT
ncbi:hypothetical protein FOL47_003415, partial [Perkinsus chesapeaki]